MGYQDSVMLVGLYVKNPTTAYRARVRLSFISQKWTAHVQDQLNAESTVNDERDFNQFGIVTGLGIQKSRGKGRLHGIYGIEGIIGYFGNKNTYSYGNAMDENHQTPLSTDWTGIYQDPSNPSPQNILDSTTGYKRVTKFDNGSEFILGVRGFIGAEYFFAPKISLSAEYGWSIVFDMNGEGELTTEFWNGSDVQTLTARTGKKSTFAADVDNAGGMIVLHVYF